MKIRELIGTAQVPGGDELRLYRRGDDFIIAIDRNELMSSRMSGSEEALAQMSCDRLRSAKAAHLLIGGYGMGFTLRAALGALGPDAKIAVAELVPGIIEWARGPMAELAAGCLDDPRVELILGDVSKAIGAATRRYDAILLDPPKFGRGPTGERWQIEEGLAPLLADCRQLLDEDSRALVLTVYAVRMSALAIGELLAQLFADLPGKIECGELAVREETRGLLLPTAIFARWSR